MGGFSSSNPLVRGGAMALDTYIGVPVASAALTVSEARERQQAQNAQQAAVQQSYDMQASSLRRQQEQQVRERQDLLKRTLATQRARLSAMGVSGGGGSSDALVAGLAQQAGADVADLEAAYGDQLSTLAWRRQQQEVKRSSAVDVWSAALLPLVSAALPGKKGAGRTPDGQAGYPISNLL